MKNILRFMPNEHGFWVMLSASILSAELRAGPPLGNVSAGAAVFGLAVLLAGVMHRQIRGREGAQLGATAALAFAGAPVESIAGLSDTEIAARTLARLGIFVASALIVRSAFARSARKATVSSLALQLIALAIVAVVGVLLAIAQRFVEARACAMSVPVYAILAWARPTAKQLKPLGLTLAGLALASAVALAL